MCWCLKAAVEFHSVPSHLKLHALAATVPCINQAIHRLDSSIHKLDVAFASAVPLLQISCHFKIAVCFRLHVLPISHADAVRQSYHKLIHESLSQAVCSQVSRLKEPLIKQDGKAVGASPFGLKLQTLSSGR